MHASCDSSCAGPSISEESNTPGPNLGELPLGQTQRMHRALRAVAPDGGCVTLAETYPASRVGFRPACDWLCFEATDGLQFSFAFLVG